MKPIYLSVIIFSGILSAFSGCAGKAHSGNNPDPGSAPDKQFNEYWYQGKAEISSYALEQARYGEIHQGSAVTIFVTEDFSRKKQVKLDNPQQAGEDKVPILKLNLTKKFNTGIYPYSMMQSVFTPVNTRKDPQSLKTTMSSQEWCGHTFTQLNLKGGDYLMSGFSYFESEGDATQKIEGKILEDELWNLIRINPDKLPTGNIELIPGSFFSRLRHRPITPEKAEISLKKEGDLQIYTIHYPGADRTLTIRFDQAFPYQIQGWEETYQSGWGAGAKTLTTKATLMKTLFTDYWNKHSNAYLGLREELGL